MFTGDSATVIGTVGHRDTAGRGTSWQLGRVAAKLSRNAEKHLGRCKPKNRSISDVKMKSPALGKISQTQLKWLLSRSTRFGGKSSNLLSLSLLHLARTPRRFLLLASRSSPSAAFPARSLAIFLLTNLKCWLYPFPIQSISKFCLLHS